MAYADTALVVETALSYFDAGIFVVPVYAPVKRSGVTDPGKQPIGKGWQTREWTRETLEQVLRKERANIGVLCGKQSGFICLDIDPKNGGLEWFYEHEHDLGAHLKEETGSGGFHLYYRYPANTKHLESFSGKYGIAAGVEFKADGGVQVITAPSLHPDGRNYFFHYGLSLLDLDTEADDPPAWLLEIVAQKTADRKAQKEAFTPIGTAPGLTDDPNEIQRALERVARIGHRRDGGVENGGRRTAALYVAYTGRDHGISPKMWWPHVVEWNRGNTPPIDEVTLRKTFENGYKYAKTPVGSKTVAAAFPDDLAEPMPLPPDEAAQQADELAENEPTKYPFKNPVRSAALYLSRAPAVVYADETFYRYVGDTWEVVNKDALTAHIWQDVVSLSPGVCLKAAHVAEITKAIQAQCHRHRSAFDRWADERPGDFVRVTNGILDLNRVELLPHSPDWFSLTKLPFAYDEHAACPRFESFLHSIWGDGETEDQIEALQLWFGYLLSSKMNQQRFAMFLGHSRGGKGTLLRVMERLVGERNTVGMNIEGFRGNFALQEFPGKKLVTVADAHAGTREALSSCAQFVLNVTGEDTVNIDRKNRSILSLRLGMKIAIGANFVPKFFDANSSITNRMILFRFIRTFQGREDLGLDDALAAEMPGIFNWAVRGLEKLNTLGKLVKPASAQETLDEIAETLNPAGAFVGEFLSPGAPSDLTYVDEVYDIYKAWCLDNGHKPYAKGRFSGVVSETFAGDRGVRRETTTWRDRGGKRTFYRGLRLLYSLDVYRANREFSTISEPISDVYGHDDPDDDLLF